MFSPETVYSLEDDQIQKIASESEESTTERLRASEKLRVLELALGELRRLDKSAIVSQGMCLVELRTVIFLTCEENYRDRMDDLKASNSRIENLEDNHTPDLSRDSTSEISVSSVEPAREEQTEEEHSEGGQSEQERPIQPSPLLAFNRDFE